MPLKKRKDGSGKFNTGRPSKYNEETANKILEKIIDGQALARICKDESYPDRCTVHRWSREIKEFRLKLLRARKDYSVSLMDDCAESAYKLQEMITTTPDDKYSNDRIKALAEVTKTSFYILSSIAGKYNKKFSDKQNVNIKSENHNKNEDVRSPEQLMDDIIQKGELPQNKKKDDDKE